MAEPPAATAWALTDKILYRLEGAIPEARVDRLPGSDDVSIPVQAESSAEIARLRELHAAMDRAVLDAYGWRDVGPECGFALDWLDLDENEHADTMAGAPEILRESHLGKTQRGFRTCQANRLTVVVRCGRPC